MTTREQRLRQLRDRIYGKPISDNEWANCKGFWLQTGEAAWLEKTAAKSEPMQ